MSTHSIDADNQAAWTRILLANELAYPDEQVVRFLAARYGQTGVPAGANGLDVGFGSGRHLKLLMDYGFKAHGLEVVPEALDVAGRRFGGEALLGELKVADMRTYTFMTDDQAAELLEQAGFTIEDYQRVELWRDRGTRRHSWWSFWVTRPAR
jgi:hypothetical protein